MVDDHVAGLGLYIRNCIRDTAENTVLVADIVKAGNTVADTDEKAENTVADTD